MKKLLLPLVAATVLSGLAAGCSTSDPKTALNLRVQEKSDVFSKLSLDRQRTIQAGYVERGYTPDMVYMVMGRPVKVQAKDAANGKLEMWTYYEYKPQFAGAKDSRNNPNASHYTTQSVSTNSARVKEEAPDAVKPTSFNFGGAAMAGLDVPDMQVNKVYLFFANGRVVEIKYDNESA